MNKVYDLFIIGGGINGSAIAADAAGRGLTVMLCEKNDLASGTSHASSKLIHGGLRYLEFYEFGLVKKALREREVLLFRAPFLIKPLEFILPHENHLRPAWMIKLGLFLYDHLSKRKYIPKSKTVNLSSDIRGKGLQPHLKKGFSYYDCFTDDSRLVVLNALSAKEHGATILTRTEFISAERENNAWKILIKDKATGNVIHQYAKVLINVSGPWVRETQQKIKNTELSCEITLDKGSHIVVKKLYEGDFAYILQNHDNRIVFAIPYLEKYTLIGTTDVHYSNHLDAIHIDPEEEMYLCHIINNYFKKNINKNDIIWSYSGVRCLKAQIGHTNATTTRDFQLLTEVKNDLPLITIIGGKLTTHRILAEEVIDHLNRYFPQMKQAWTSALPLPGGDIPDISQFHAMLKNQFSWLPNDLLQRYINCYGTNIFKLFHNIHSINDLGMHFSHGLYQKEIEYLIKNEWAKTAEDILWRRTKLGLSFNEEETKNLKDWIKNQNTLPSSNSKKNTWPI